MNEPIQLIPALTVLEDSGEFTVRIGEAKWAADLGRQIVTLIGSTGVARKLVIVTPSDTKVFKFDRQAGEVRPTTQRTEIDVPAPSPPSLKPSQRISQDTAAPPAPELVGEFEEELERQRKAEAEIVAQQKELKSDPQITPDDEEGVVEIPKRRGRPSKVEATLKAATACGRCQGQGSLEGGGTCPVCRGVGSIAHYGRGR